jgi:hypothetical protein
MVIGCDNNSITARSYHVTNCYTGRILRNDLFDSYGSGYGLGVLFGTTYLIHLAQDMDQWRVLVKTAVKVRVPLKAGNFLASRAVTTFSTRTMLLATGC